MFRLLTVILLVLAGQVHLVAQDDDSAELLIAVQINPRGDGGYPAGESQYADDILEALLNIFPDAPFDIVFLTEQSNLRERVPIFADPADYPDVYAPESPTLALSIVPFGTFGENDGVYLSPFSGFVNPPLPVAISAFTNIMILGGVDNQTTVGDIVNGVAAIGGYIAGACDFAIPYMESILADETLLEDGAYLTTGIGFYLGSCAYQNGDVDGAISAYETALAVNDTTGDEDPRLFTESVAINLAWIYEQRGMNTAALALLDAHQGIDYLAFTGRELPPAFAMIRLYTALGDADAAFARFDDLLAIADESELAFTDDEIARIYAERGWLHAQLAQFDAALADFETAIEIDPAYPKVYFYRGLVYDDLDDMSAALDDLTTFLDLEAGYFGYYEDDLTSFIARARKLIDMLD